MSLDLLRMEYHKELCKTILKIDSKGISSNSDKHSEISVILARDIINQIGRTRNVPRLSGQTSGRLFESITKNYLENAFKLILHLRCSSSRDRH